MDACVAMDRWVAALNAPTDRNLLSAAVAPDVVVERCAPGTDTAVLETFTGIDALSAWLAKTAARAVFSLSTAVIAEGDHFRVKYAIDLDDFHNHGIWIARVTTDDRILHLEHRPFAL